MKPSDSSAKLLNNFVDSITKVKVPEISIMAKKIKLKEIGKNSLKKRQGGSKKGKKEDESLEENMEIETDESNYSEEKSMSSNQEEATAQDKVHQERDADF